MSLKVDLHLHSREDPRHHLKYGARDLIAAAARHGYHAISITNHNRVTYCDDLAAFAWDRGVLLIPGVEATVRGKHVLLYGVEGMEEDWENLDFLDLRRLRAKGAFVIAPHPFYPGYNCLGRDLSRFPGLFDAIEYSHLYVRRVNFNLRAMAFARHRGIPLVGLSDAHSLAQLDYTYTLVDAPAEPREIFRAIVEGRTQVVSHPARLSTTSVVGLQLFSTFLAMRLLP